MLANLLKYDREDLDLLERDMERLYAQQSRGEMPSYAYEGDEGDEEEQRRRGEEEDRRRKEAEEKRRLDEERARKLEEARIKKREEERLREEMLRKQMEEERLLDEELRRLGDEKKRLDEERAREAEKKAKEEEEANERMRKKQEEREALMKLIQEEERKKKEEEAKKVVVNLRKSEAPPESVRQGLTGSRFQLQQEDESSWEEQERKRLEEERKRKEEEERKKQEEEERNRKKDPLNPNVEDGDYSMNELTVSQGMHNNFRFSPTSPPPPPGSLPFSLCLLSLTLVTTLLGSAVEIQTATEEQQSSICEICGEPLKGFIVLVDHKDLYHLDCFVCTDCGAVFEDFYWEYDGKPLCFEHYLRAAKLYCEACSQPIRVSNTLAQRTTHNAPLTPLPQPSLPLLLSSLFSLFSLFPPSLSRSLSSLLLRSPPPPSPLSRISSNRFLTDSRLLPQQSKRW